MKKTSAERLNDIHKDSFSKNYVYFSAEDVQNSIGQDENNTLDITCLFQSYPKRTDKETEIMGFLAI